MLVSPWQEDYVWCGAACESCWVLNFKTPMGLPSASGYASPFRPPQLLSWCSGFHFCHSHIQVMDLFCQRRLWRMGQESCCRLFYVSTSKPMSPMKIKRKYKSRQNITFLIRQVRFEAWTWEIPHYKACLATPVTLRKMWMIWKGSEGGQ